LALFRFKQFSYDSERQTLTQSEVSCKLDPKAADLLDYFIAHAGDVLSRDQLLDEVWAGTVVSDNTISWSVSQLRKALGDDSANPGFIQTIPKKGYSFIAQVEQLPPSHFEEVSIHGHSKSVNSRLRNTLWSSVLVATLLVLIWAFNHKELATEYKIGPAKLLTSMDGLEEDGSVSEDGILMVFRHKSSTVNSKFQIYLKPLFDPTTFNETLDTGEISAARLSSQREQNPYSLTEDNFDYKQVIWGKDSYQLFAVRTVEQRCEIVELTLPVSRDSILQQRLLSSCDLQGKTHLAFSPKFAVLYFTDTRNSDSYTVQKLDLQTAVVSQLTTTDTPGLGDHFIDLDTTQSKLLILRNKHWSETEFLILDLHTQTLSLLFEIPSVYYSVFWGPKGESIWYNWGNATVLRYDLDSQASTTLLQTAYGWNYDTHPIGNDGAVFTVSDANSADFLYLQDSNLEKKLTPYTEYLPTHSSITGKLAYVSDQSGLPQIWLQAHPAKAATQLSNMTEFKEFTDLSWATDDKWLLGVTDGAVGAIDVERQIYHKLYKGELRAQLPSLSGTRNTLLFSAQQNGVWQLFIHDVQTQLNRKLGEGFQSQWLAEEQFLFSRKGKTGLWKYDIYKEKASLLLKDFPAVDFWKLVNDRLYFTSKIPVWGLYETPLNHYTPTKVTDLPNKTGRQFSINPIDNGVVLEDWRRQQSDLKLAPLIYQ
jgi:DNA-binding winged helix-turn-helix (wHTH) protein/Tol biopolymer transport system component